MNVVAGGNRYLYAIEDLGRGSSGRVWLTSAHRGAVCVLKFANTADNDLAKQRLTKECAMWHTAYPDLTKHVAVEKRSGRWALRMPHFSRIPQEDQQDYIDAVRNTLRVHFVAKNLMHTDVSWKNIGQYKNRDKTTIIVYDLADVDTRQGGDWVDEAVANLKH